VPANRPKVGFDESKNTVTLIGRGETKPAYPPPAKKESWWVKLRAKVQDRKEAASLKRSVPHTTAKSGALPIPPPPPVPAPKASAKVMPWMRGAKGKGKGKNKDKGKKNKDKDKGATKAK
jgi:hypothetical protein